MMEVWRERRSNQQLGGGEGERQVEVSKAYDGGGLAWIKERIRSQGRILLAEGHAQRRRALVSVCVVSQVNVLAVPSRRRWDG